MFNTTQKLMSILEVEDLESKEHIDGITGSIDIMRISQYSMRQMGVVTKYPISIEVSKSHIKFMTPLYRYAVSETDAEKIIYRNLAKHHNCHFSRTPSGIFLLGLNMLYGYLDINTVRLLIIELENCANDIRNQI